MPARRMCDSEEAEVGKLYRVGKYPVGRIAMAYGFSAHCIRGAFKRCGVSMRTLSEAMLERQPWTNGTHRMFSDEEETEIVKVYEKGPASARAMGEAYKCSDSTILNIVHRRQGTTHARYDIRLGAGRDYGCIDSGGYVCIHLNRLGGRARELGAQMANSRDYVLVHRLLMACKLNRPLSSEEVVHHRDGNRANYRRGNLVLLTQERHPCGHGNPYYQYWQEAESRIRRLEAKIAILETASQ